MPSSRPRSNRWNAKNIQYFDHRREYARTDWDNGGIPARAWEDLLGEMRKRRRQGWLAALRPACAVRWPRRPPTWTWPLSGNTWHTKDSGCTTTCRTSRRSSAISRRVIMMDRFGTDEQKSSVTEALRSPANRSLAFGLTEPNHGSDAYVAGGRGPSRTATAGHQRRQAVQHRSAQGDPRPWSSPATSGEPGQARGITAFLVPTDIPGFAVGRTTGGRSTCPPTT